MTYIPYNTVETINYVPAQASTPLNWPGYDGCSQRSTNWSRTGVYPPTGTTNWYQPLIDFGEQKDPRNFSGRPSNYRVRKIYSTKLVYITKNVLKRIGNKLKRERITIPILRRTSHKVGGRFGNRFEYTRWLMTPYWVKSHKLENFLIRRGPYTTRYHETYLQSGSVAKWGGSTCSARASNVDHYIQTVSYYTQQHDFSSYQNYVVSSFNDEEIADAFDIVKEEAARDALSSYDFLTELAEAKEIPGLLISYYSDLTKIARMLRGNFDYKILRYGAQVTPKQLMKSSVRVLRKLGDEWMQYRYGVMPLVYSINDIMKLMNRGFDSTSRKKKVISPRASGVSLPAPTTTYRWTQDEGTITISATVFQHFSSTEVARLSGLTVNPLVTAWELVPYSFVFDWFLNIGNYIAVKSCQTFANMCQSCISRRDAWSRVTYVHSPTQSVGVSHGLTYNTPWLGTVPSVSALPNQNIWADEQMLSRETFDYYERQLFNIRDVKLRVDPSLNWRRGIDSVVLASNLLRNLTRFNRR